MIKFENTKLRRDTLNMDITKEFVKFGISVMDAENAFDNFAKSIPKFTQSDILAISINPSLSLIEKYLIIRRIKKQM